LDSNEDEDDNSKKPSNSNSNNSGKKKTPLPSNSPKNKKKSSIGKIIGLVFGILLLLCLIGGIAFYFIQKNRSNQSSVLSSSSPVNIETGNNKGASVPAQNKSQQSLPHTGGMQNQPSTKDKPNISLQKAADKKRQRAGTSMALNDDI
jgi:flagellar basal body-associated protein FliL